MESESWPKENPVEVFGLDFQVRQEVKEYENEILRNSYIELRKLGKSDESGEAYEFFLKDFQEKLERRFAGADDENIRQSLQFRQQIFVELASAFVLRDAGLEDDAIETFDAVWNNLENFLSGEIPEREYFEELKRQISSI